MSSKLAGAAEPVMVASLDKEAFTSTPGTDKRHNLSDALSPIIKDPATMELPPA